MLTYINVTIENNPYKGGLVIKSTSNVDDIGDVASIVISRKRSDSNTWEEIYTISVAAIEDFSFELVDYITLSGVLYDYNFDIMDSTGVIPIESGIIHNTKCSFEGLFVGNANRQYIAGANFKTETNRNTQVQHVTTLEGKYPYRVSNANTNYTTGKSAGLFLKLTEDKRRFVPDSDHSYSKEILDFLTDGTSKVIKTHDGQAWYVSIDANPKEVYSDFIGAHSIDFSWTEIGDLPRSLMAGVDS